MSSQHGNKKFPQRPLPSKSPSPDFGSSRAVSPTRTPHIRRYSDESIKTVQLETIKTNQKVRRWNQQPDKLGNPKSRQNPRQIGEGLNIKAINNISVDSQSAKLKLNTNQAIQLVQGSKINHIQDLDTSRRVRGRFDCSRSPRGDFGNLEQQSPSQSPEDFSPPIREKNKLHQSNKQLQKQVQEATMTINRLRSALQTNETHLYNQDRVQGYKLDHQNKRDQPNQKSGFIQNKSRSMMKSHYQRQIKKLEVTIQKMVEGSNPKRQSLAYTTTPDKDKDMDTLKDRISQLEQELHKQRVSKNLSQQALQLAHNNLDSSQSILQIVTDENQKLKATIAKIKLQHKYSSRPDCKLKQQQGTPIQHLARSRVQVKIASERPRMENTIEAYPCAQQTETPKAHMQSLDTQKLSYYADRHKFIESARLMQSDNYKLTRQIQVLQFQIQKLTVVCERHQDDNEVLIKQIKHLEAAIQSYLKNPSQESIGVRRRQGFDTKHYTSLNLEDARRTPRGATSQLSRLHIQTRSPQMQAGPVLTQVYD